MHDRIGCIRLLASGALVAAAGLASGCMSSPTYGTDRTANEQLMSDLGNITSFSDKKRAPIDYSPRPDLVKPAKGDETLPAPQDSVTAANNPNWPESPEQRLARIRNEATENADDPNYKSPVVPDVTLASTESAKPRLGVSQRDVWADDKGVDQAARSAEIKKRLQESQQGSSTTRKFLSDPPLTYREAAADAPQGELGEDEYKKERRLKAEARKGKGWSWSDLNPF